MRKIEQITDLKVLIRVMSNHLAKQDWVVYEEHAKALDVRRRLYKNLGTLKIMLYLYNRELFREYSGRGSVEVWDALIRPISRRGTKLYNQKKRLERIFAGLSESSD